MNYKSGLGFVPALEVPFFGPSIWPFSPKVPELRSPKLYDLKSRDASASRNIWSVLVMKNRKEKEKEKDIP